MKLLGLSFDYLAGFVNEQDLSGIQERMEGHGRQLHAGTGPGADYLGWLSLPSQTPKSLLRELESVADHLRQKADYVVVTGIGGSYLGARAVIEALAHSFAHLRPVRKDPAILYAGHHLSEDYHAELLKFLEDKSFAVVVISKSGTTTEPALAFRMLRNLLEKNFSPKEVASRIVAVTDAKRGVLRQLADREGYKSFVIPDDVGGRFSVLTPVGLLPIAIAGFDIRELIKGAAEMEAACHPDRPVEENPAARYAAARNALYQKGMNTEVLVNYHPKLHFVAEWWKQLYGESEGKDGKGIFPAAVDLTTDLHSMGQYLQDGRRTLFETVIEIAKPRRELLIPELDGDGDALNFVAGKRLDEVNHMAALGTLLAHVDGGVPVMRIELPALKERYLGQLLYFFEKACALSGYELGVNPFDQPGVEAYKRNMFALLGKPGFETESEQLFKRLGL